MSALEELAQAVLDGRVRVYATGWAFDGRSGTTYDIAVDPKPEPEPEPEPEPKTAEEPAP